MASVTFTDYGLASDTNWVGDYLTREHNLPGGGQLAAAGWVGLTDNVVPAGTIVGRTNAEAAAGADFGPAGDADDEVFLTLHPVNIVTGDRGVALYRHGSVVRFTSLPSWAGASAAVQGKLRAAYQLVAGE